MWMADARHAGAGRFVGARVQRAEDPRLITGSGRYVDDIRLPRMLHAAFVRSPHAHARVTGIDTSAAAAIPGVAAILTAADLNGETTGPLWSYRSERTPFPAINVLAADEVCYAGDPVAIVVATDRYVAEDAAELVDVHYEPLPAVVGRTYALSDEALAHTSLETNLAWSAATPLDPELDAAFAASAHVFTQTIHQQRYTQVPMEPRSVVADWRPGGQLHVHMASQVPHQDRRNFSTALGVPEQDVRVTTHDVGGGFGQKLFTGREPIAVAQASRRLGCPVKWIEDREENLRAASHARDEELTIKVGVDDEGVIQALYGEALVDMGAMPFLPGAAPAVLALALLPGPYRVDRYGWRGRSVFTNTSGLGAYRGPWLMETVGREIMLDIVARGIGLDPAELRRRNILRPQDLPYVTATGREYDYMTPEAAFEAALEAADYDGFRERQRRARDEGRHLGIGISSYVEPTAGSAGGGRIEVATIRVEPSGKINLLMGTGSHGQSLETTMPQVVADQLGVPLEDVRLIQGDTESAPYGHGTHGSRSAVVAGNAARASAVRLREKIFALAGHLLEAAPEDLEIEAGVISVIGAPSSQITLAQVAHAAYNAPDDLPEGIEPGLENTSRFIAPPVTYANATHVCTCEVNIATGEVTLLDYVVAGDCGVIINPNVVEGQIAGGVAQGIGGALLEHFVYDEAGNPLTTTFKDYLLPTTADVPDIRYVHLETPGPTPGGHKGIGEGGAIGSPPAVVNAVADALAPLGVRVTEPPLSPPRVLALLDAAGASAKPSTDEVLDAA